MEESPSPVRWLVLDATAITGIPTGLDRDEAGLEKASVILALVLVPMTHQVSLEQVGLIDLVGANRIFDSRRACLEAYESAWSAGNPALSGRRRRTVMTHSFPVVDGLKETHPGPSH